jgi:3,4-dihydroxy 2-butanone 4-phosphate synthase/GTP cyclohydrolase II
MFTGIVSGLGTVREIVANTATSDMRLVIGHPWPVGTEIALGASIACSGCCLTAVEVGPDWFAVEASGETLSKTSLGGWRVGSRVNLERPLKIGDELGGHIVAGPVAVHCTEGQRCRGRRFADRQPGAGCGIRGEHHPPHRRGHQLRRACPGRSGQHRNRHRGALRGPARGVLMSDIVTRTLSDYLSSAEELIEEARNGRMFVLADDEDRENEGDLIIPAQFATPAAVNFMARHARGLICLALTQHRVEQLGLPLMSQSNGTRHSTAFTISVEARDGVTTGISAHDRAHTIAVAINPEASRHEIVTPGHVFPLMAREGGSLVRAGVICEIMNDDGSMARLPELVAFAQHHNLKLGTVADLIAYRRRTERLVRKVEEGVLNHAVGGDWRVIVYANTVEYAEHLVLVKGDLAEPGPALVRMHQVDLMEDIVGGKASSSLHGAMQMIAEAGRGAVVMLRETRAEALSDRVRKLSQAGRTPTELRDYGIGAQILLDLGVTDLVLLSNTHRTIIGIEGYGLTVVDQREIDTSPAGGHD